MQCHPHSQLTITTTGSRGPRISYMNDSCYGAGREQCTDHEGYVELVNEHYKELVNGLFDDMTLISA